MNFSYKTVKTIEERVEEFNKISKASPGKIPIICEKAPKSKIKSIDKTKYLINGDITVAQFSSIIRKKLNIDKESALFLLVKGKNALAGNDPMSTIYQKYKDEDGFLYIAYASELVWGSNKNKNNK